MHCTRRTHYMLQHSIQSTITRRSLHSTSIALQQQSLRSLKHRSITLTGDPSHDKEYYVKRSACRAFLRAVGWKDEDFSKPIIAVCAPSSSTYSPCNAHFDTIGQLLAQAIERNGGKAIVFSTPTINDGMTMGTEGMRYSLCSRELIADSVETMYEGYYCDGLITVGGCDKTQPGAVIPIVRSNAIGISLYGGTILPGLYKGKDISVGNVFEGIGALNSGKINDSELKTIECSACPGSGACGGMFTANTMAIAFEALGITPTYSAAHPAVDRNNNINSDKRNDIDNAVKHLFSMLKSRTHIRDIISKKSFENAITIVQALGGSTNAVLHLLAIAKEANIDLKINEFNRIGSKVPLLGNFKPYGRYHMEDLYKIGGVPAVMKLLNKHNLIHTECKTVNGATWGQILQDSSIPELSDNQDIVYIPNKPLAPPMNHIIVLHGNLAPGGAVMKLGGKNKRVVSGTARVFDTEMEAWDAVLKGHIQDGDVVIIRYEGPKGMG